MTLPSGVTRKTRERIDAIRKVYSPGMSARKIAAAIGTTKGTICSLYNRYPAAFVDTPLQAYSGGVEAKGKIRKKRAEKPSVWTPEKRARVAELLKEKMSARQIAQEFGCSRNAIIGLVGRDPSLGKLQGKAFIPRRLTDEERRANRLKAAENYNARTRERRPPAERKPFKPVVVSTNTKLMIADWIAANGVRRFEAKDSSEYYRVQTYLAERGWNVSMYANQYTMAGPNGRKRSVKWKDVLVVADRFRMAEGLQPFLAA